MQFCVSITGLKANTAYNLIFPAGTKYGVSSVLSKDVTAAFTSTLDFVIPLKRGRSKRQRQKKRKSIRVSSTQLVIFFPHGLAEGTANEALKGRLRLDEVAAPWGGPVVPVAVPFSVEITSMCALPLPAAWFCGRWTRQLFWARFFWFKTFHGYTQDTFALVGQLEEGRMMRGTRHARLHAKRGTHQRFESIAHEDTMQTRQRP
jgi:hypothetical protein